MPQPPDKERQAEIDFTDSCRYVRQRQKYLADPKNARSYVNRVVARHGIAATLADDQLQRAWAQVIGDEFRERTRVGPFQRGTLVIYVANSSVLQRLKFLEHEILPQLQSQQPHFGIEKLRLRVGVIN